MADEYILKNKVLNLIEYNDRVCHYADERYENVVYATAQTLCKVVADIPAADVQPVKHGKFIPFTDKQFYEHFKAQLHNIPFDGECSICGAKMFNTDNYCGECGARMEEGQDD